MTWRLNILLVVTIWVMVANQSLHAQELRSVRGIVMDSVTRKAIENVTVVINGKSLYAITNTEGHFEFHFPRQYAQDTLVFSCVGYKAKQVPLKSIGDDITVTLPESKVILSELIVSPTDELKVKAIIQRAMESIKNNFADTVIISGYFKSTIIT